ncbi:hypothetical protein [Umezawaea sp.]|uniref:hypothetical protein n=1 Tax=Umezawaea sp. TaxID=1955258 RepID=UPI002ED0DD5C
MSLVDAHSALFDAHAAAGLFSGYLRSAGRPLPWQELLDSAPDLPWPSFGSTSVRPVRRGEVVAAPVVRAPVSLVRGDTVVFTGQMSDPRDVWVDRASAAGLRVIQGYVTKATRVLVAADPFTLSSKARRARAYEVPIVSEHDFGSMIARLV